MDRADHADTVSTHPHRCGQTCAQACHAPAITRPPRPLADTPSVTHERTILIGTRDTVDLLNRQLNLLETPPTVVGAVLIDEIESANLSQPLIVLGSAEEASDICRAHHISQAIVSAPASLAAQERQVRSALGQIGIRVRIVAPLPELLASEPMSRGARLAPSIDLAALVGRKAQPLDRERLSKLIAGSRVLITGAGGSIGSEIARICANFNPAMLVLVERSENALFEIDRSLARHYPSLPRQAVLHDIVQADRTDALIRDTRPDLIFHAAAHKHVPLMEDHPSHAITNNLFGTRAIADAAVRHAVGRFVLISSDKAVNPTSVMGATKRLAEMYVQSLGARHDHTTRLSMVRFGNVLGSACSVLPIWASQIAEGGPVTVTDERMTRYFMTIPEAAGLVIHAASMSRLDHTEVFVLDMGDPISIVEMAERFIAAHGLASVRNTADAPLPMDTIAIHLTGARPGEKLHEELAYQAELLSPTQHPGIFALSDAQHTDPTTIAAMLEHLDRARHDQSAPAVVRAIARFVPQLGSIRAAA